MSPDQGSNARTAFLGSVLIYMVVLLIAASTLPSRVAIHFGANGNANDHTSKGWALVTFGLVGFLLIWLLGGIARYAPYLPMSFFNLPNKAYWTKTPEREAVMRSRVGHDVLVIGTATTLLLTVVLLLTIRANNLTDPHLDGLTIGVIAAYVVGLLFYLTWMTLVRYRPEPE